MTNKYVLIVLFSTFLASGAQILLKISADRDNISMFNEYINFYVITSYFIFLCTLLLNIIAYKGLDFKIGPVIASTSYIFVLIFENIFLKEKATKNKILGNVFIILGIIIFSI